MDQWNINYISVIPLHKQLEGKIIRSLKNGELKEGDLLPSIQRLSKVLTLSVSTTSKVYRNLIKEGILDHNKGKGYFVAETCKEIFKNNNHYKSN